MITTDQMVKSIVRLLPPGMAWRAPAGYLRSLLTGLAAEPVRVAEFLYGVAREANPGTAVHTLEEWFLQYGMAWSPTGSVAVKQGQALARYISLGGQDIVYFQNCINQAGFEGITVEEGSADEQSYYADTLLNALTIAKDFFIADTVGNDLAIDNSGADEPFYPNTEGNDLTISETADTDAFYPATLDNDLTRSTNAMPHYIAATVGNDCTVTYLYTDMGGHRYTLSDFGLYLSNPGDIGKTLRFIDSSGTTLATATITSFGGSSGSLLATITSLGAIPAVPTGTITGGLWGFSTETVLDVGDYNLTAESAHFASGDVGKDIDYIDANGDVFASFTIVKYVSTTAVGVNFTSGTFPFWGTVQPGGFWDFEGSAITRPGDYTLTAASAYPFSAGDIGKYIKIINTAGAQVTLLLIKSYLDTDEITADIEEGTAPASADGGKWDFSTEALLFDYVFTADALTWVEGDIGKTIIYINAAGETVAAFEVTGYSDTDTINCELTSGVAPDSVVGGKWGFSTATITESYTLTSQHDFFVVGNIGDAITIITPAGVEVCEIEITGFTDAKNITGEKTSGTVPVGVTAAGLWDFSTETALETVGNIFYFYLRGNLNTTEAAQGLAALVQRISPAHLSPVYDINLDLNVYGAAVCGSGYCSAK